MVKLVLTLISGRTMKQGAGISAGKDRFEYREETSIVDLNAADMTRAGIRGGDRVRITTEFGSSEIVCRSAELPEGLAFMAFGPACNRLVGSETYASGMPDSKNVVVEITRIDSGKS